MQDIRFRLTNQETIHARICQTTQKNQLFFHFLYLEYMFTINIQKQTIEIKDSFNPNCEESSTSLSFSLYLLCRGLAPVGTPLLSSEVKL